VQATDLHPDSMPDAWRVMPMPFTENTAACIRIADDGRPRQRPEQQRPAVMSGFFRLRTHALSPEWYLRQKVIPDSGFTLRTSVGMLLTIYPL
jgi:hypothetical protein